MMMKDCRVRPLAEEIPAPLEALIFPSWRQELHVAIVPMGVYVCVLLLLCVVVLGPSVEISHDGIRAWCVGDSKTRGCSMR